MGNYDMPHGALARFFLAVRLTPLTAVQYILCDIICAWRTVVLWNRDNNIVAILLLFNLVTIGT
jgi:hypothetical protein